MTLLGVQQPPSPTSRPRRRWIAVVLGVLILATGGVFVATFYYDSVPAPQELRLTYPTVSVEGLPLPVANAFVAAVDPDFYEDSIIPAPSLVTRRYAVIAASTPGEESSWRAKVMAAKLEDKYTRTDILGFYLNSADFGRGAVGLVAAAQTYFGKQPAQLNVAEAAVLAVQLHPDRPEPKAGWTQVLETMVQHGWLDDATRATLTYPAK